MNILKDEDGVYICNDCNDFMQTFIDIYIDGKGTPSPFKTVEDAELFAKIIIKLLGVINDDIE